MDIGDMFEVTETADFRDRDVVVGRYQPGHGYRVTARNRAFVAYLEAAGIARPHEPAAGTARVRGTAKTL